MMLISLFKTVVIVAIVTAAPTAINIDICNQTPTKQGNTEDFRVFFRTYTYNATARECQIYFYGGSYSGGNLFDSVLECERICAFKKNNSNMNVETIEETGENYRNKICLQPRMSGYCRAFIPSFYYSAKKKRCRSFVYGGCGGNTNNFKTRQECKSVCEI